MHGRSVREVDLDPTSRRLEPVSLEQRHIDDRGLSTTFSFERGGPVDHNDVGRRIEVRLFGGGQFLGCRHWRTHRKDEQREKPRQANHDACLHRPRFRGERNLRGRLAKAV
jgi:hypothetical protein